MIRLEVLQERIIAVEHDQALAIGERGAIRIEAALERVEARILVGRQPIQTGGFGITLAAQLLSVTFGLGQKHGTVPFGLGADGL